MRVLSSAQNKGAPKGLEGGGLPGSQAAPQPQKVKFKKNINFVDNMMSKVLTDLSFSRIQPLKSVDE